MCIVKSVPKTDRFRMLDIGCRMPEEGKLKRKINLKLATGNLGFTMPSLSAASQLHFFIATNS
jgi:hypothetical protein